MKQIRKNAGGIDIGAKHIFVGLESHEVKIFETFTVDLERCAICLLENNIKTVAM